MALITYSPAISDMRGSVGASTFTRSRAGNIIRTKIKPCEQQSNAHTQARAYLSILTDAWANTLTDAQRIAWNDLANQTTLVNALGRTHQPTGRDLFLRVNIPVTSDHPLIDTAPDTALYPIVPLSMRHYTGPDRLRVQSIGNNPCLLDTLLMLWYSNPIKTTINTQPKTWNFSGIYVYWATNAVDTSITITTPSFYPCRVWVRARALGPGYELSHPTHLSVDIAAP